jgi:hypothetical protein
MLLVSFTLLVFSSETSLPAKLIDVSGLENIADTSELIESARKMYKSCLKDENIKRYCVSSGINNAILNYNSFVDRKTKSTLIERLKKLALGRSVAEALAQLKKEISSQSTSL